MEVQLDFLPREKGAKSAKAKMRREGFIPCVIYKKGKAGENGAIKKEFLAAALRKIEAGFLPTTIFQLKDGAGKTRKAIVKDIQYDITSYDVIHIDFLELVSDQKVEIKVPLVCLGANDCPGVKAGGFLSQVRSHLPSRCLPKDIPSHFEINVVDLNMRQGKRISDLKVPKGVEILLDPKEVIATVIK